MSTAATDTRRPSEYQIEQLRANGIKVRPRTYESAQKRVGALPPTDNQVALLKEIGLPIPADRNAASAAITAYEADHPEWTAARRRARVAKGAATRAANRAGGQLPQYNDTLLRYHTTGVERFGTTAASKERLALLRALALRLPQDNDARIGTFAAMGRGLSQDEAGRRITEVRQLLA